MNYIYVYIIRSHSEYLLQGADRPGDGHAVVLVLLSHRFVQGLDLLVYCALLIREGLVLLRGIVVVVYVLCSHQVLNQLTH